MKMWRGDGGGSGCGVKTKVMWWGVMVMMVEEENRQKIVFDCRKSQFAFILLTMYNFHGYFTDFKSQASKRLFLRQHESLASSRPIIALKFTRKSVKSVK